VDMGAFLVWVIQPYHHFRPKTRPRSPPRTPPTPGNHAPGQRVGTKAMVAERLADFKRELEPDEFIISMPFYDQTARERSMELVMEVRGR